MSSDSQRTLAMASSDSRNSCEFAECAPSAESPTTNVPSASFNTGRTTWNPDVRETHLMRAPGVVRLTKLSLCRSVTATAVWHTPVHRFGGSLGAPATTLSGGGFWL